MIQLPPKTLQRVEKLKVYAILSGEKGEALKGVGDKLVLSLILAYNDSEALVGAKDMIQRVGRQPELYQTPFMITKAEIEKLLPDLNQQNLVGGEVEASPDQIADYVERVFAVVATPSQRKIADSVIKKYKKHVKFLPKIPIKFGPAN